MLPAGSSSCAQPQCQHKLPRAPNLPLSAGTHLSGKSCSQCWGQAQSCTSGRAARQGLIQMVLQEGAPCPAACAADEELKGIPCAEAVSD